MADDGDRMLWSTVAFLEKLPTLSDDDYDGLWLASQAGGGAMDMGGMKMNDMAPDAPAAAAPTPADAKRQ